MGMAKNYIEAHKAICKVVEESFRKMSKHCEFHKVMKEARCTRSECFYSSQSAKHCCAREICPILEGE
jgi:hypothetical protein